MTDHISKIDSDRFGFLIAKMNWFGEDPAIEIKRLKEEGVKLVMSRVSSAEIGLLNELEAIGFLTKDIQVTYSFNYTERTVLPDQQKTDFSLRDAIPSDTIQIAALARKAFHNYGHYFADTKLDRNKCDLIYEDWAMRSCTDKNIADKIIVAANGREVLGFLSFKKISAEKIIKGVMGAVSAGARGKGLFRAINIHGLHWAGIQDVERLQHNVIITNIPVNKTYAHLGFTVIQSEITLHKWL